MATKPPSRAAAQRAQGIVSSSHLVSPRSVEASEFEFGMIVAWNAFSRWMVRCMQAAGVPDLTVTDVLVLHHVNHRARNKKLADRERTVARLNDGCRKLLAARLGFEVEFR